MESLKIQCVVPPAVHEEWQAGQWEWWLNNIAGMGGTEQVIQNASALLTWVMDARRKVVENLGPIANIHFMISTNNTPPRMEAIMDPPNLVLNGYLLKQRAEKTLGTVITKEFPDPLTGEKTAIFQGTTVDLYWLTGLEEFHHAWLRQNPKYAKEGSAALRGSSLAAYDAQPVEFEALEFQLEMAKKENLWDVTIGVLEARYEAARLLRPATR